MFSSNASTTSEITVNAILEASKHLQRQKAIEECAWNAMMDTLIKPFEFRFSDEEIDSGMRIFYPVVRQTA